MSQFHTLRHAVLEGPPADLFRLGEHLVRALSARLATGDDVKALSGPEMAKIVHDWATFEQENG